MDNPGYSLKKIGFVKQGQTLKNNLPMAICQHDKNLPLKGLNNSFVSMAYQMSVKYEFLKMFYERFG